MKKNACVASVLLGLCLASGCATNQPLPPNTSAFLEKPSPADGAVGVGLTNALAWSYVGQGLIPMPTADVLTNGVLLGTGYMGTNAWPSAFQPGELVSWQVVAHTAAGIVTGPVWHFTAYIAPPVPVPPAPVPDPGPSPSPTNAPATGLIRGVMFMPAKVPQASWIQMGPPWPDSQQAYWRCAGTSYENDYRQWLVQATAAWGGNALVAFADKLPKMSQAFACFTCDTIEDDGITHVPDGENSARWLTAACGTPFYFINILNDSPDLVIPLSGQDGYVKYVVSCYKGARGIVPLYLIGLECNRNMTVTQVVSAANTVRKYAGPDARVIAGSANLDYLKSVHAADAGIELWKEVDQHPIINPLTMVHRWYQSRPARHTDAFDTNLGDMTARNTYLSELDQLAALVGPGKVWAGEWYAQSSQSRLEITAAILQRKMNCGCGQYKASTYGFYIGPNGKAAIEAGAGCLVDLFNVFGGTP